MFLKLHNNYARGIILGFKRSLRHQNISQVRIKIQNTRSNMKSSFFLGKKVIYVEKNSKKKKKKIVLGKIISLHGRSGIFIAKFVKNLPPSSICESVRIMLFPFKQTTKNEIYKKKRPENF